MAKGDTTITWLYALYNHAFGNTWQWHTVHSNRCARRTAQVHDICAKAQCPHYFDTYVNDVRIFDGFAMFGDCFWRIPFHQPPWAYARSTALICSYTATAFPALKTHLTCQTANFPKLVTARTIAIRRRIITPHYLELAEKVWMLLNEKWKKKRLWDEQADLKIWISIVTTKRFRAYAAGSGQWAFFYKQIAHFGHNAKEFRSPAIA